MTGSGRRRPVLCIEDNETNLRLIELVLERAPNVELVPARTAAEALRLAAERRPDLILLDLNLPDAHGSDLLGELGAAAPVVVVSADASPATVERLRRAGVREYLTKPIDIRRLLDVVERTLEEPR